MGWNGTPDWKPGWSNYFTFPSSVSVTKVRIPNQESESSYAQTRSRFSAIAISDMPVAATAATNPAASLSVSKDVRAGAANTKKSKLAGSGLIIVALAAVAVGGGLYLAIENKDNNSDSNGADWAAIKSRPFYPSSLSGV